VLVLALAVHACSSSRPSAVPATAAALPALEQRAASGPAATYRARQAHHDQGTLFIALQTAEGPALAAAPLRPGHPNGSAAPSGDPYQRSRAIVPLTLTRLAAPEGSEPVPVLGTQQWNALLRAMHESIAPGRAEHGAVIDVLSQHELFVFRDEQGTVRVVPIEYKAGEQRIERSYPLDRLLARFAAAQRETLGIAVSDSGLVLFETGDAEPRGYPFALVDVKRPRALFLQAGEPPADAQAGLPGSVVAQAGAHTVAGHLRSALEQPVSSVARLVTLTTSNLADLVHPGALVAPADPVPPVRAAQPMDLQAWERELDRLVGRKVHRGQVRLRIDGEEFFPALLNAIEDAKRSIDLRVYIFDNDDYALQIADLLRRRSAQVRVRVLVDGLGTLGGTAAAPDYLPPGYQAPASIVAYLTQDSAVQVKVLPNPWMTGDHTKTIIVDGAIAFVGGMNIGREYRYEWHDLMVEASGPVVGALRADFEHAWAEQRLLGELWTFLRRANGRAPSARADDYPLRILRTLPADAQILRAQIAAIRQAQQRIYIQNAYFTSDAILHELARARRRGVDVRVILPYRNDSGVFQRSNAIAANFMLANGIRVYIYPGMSHVKGAVYDGWACFGSANFDSLSLRVNRELNLATSHPQAVAELVDRVFVQDMQRSVELTKPFPEKWSDFLTELLSDRL
jgi:cardiolipin synthase